MTPEKTAWNANHLPGQRVPAALAGKALRYWVDFFRPLEGASDAEHDFSGLGQAALLLTVRAMSWVESKHGTAAGSSAIDPMQCGNKRDAWWRVLSGKAKHDYFKLPPGMTPPPNSPKRPRDDGMWAFELVSYVDADANASDAVRLKGLGDKIKDGHDADKFNPEMSYFWALPLLIQKANRASPRLTYHFGEWDYMPYVLKTRHSLRMIDGAVAYNGNGDKAYRTKIHEALDLIRASEGG